MAGDNLYSTDIDYNATAGNFAPTSGRTGNAPASPQGGRVCLFLNSATGFLSQANVDTNGNLTVSPINPAGGATQVYTGQNAPASASQYGPLSFGRQDAPSPSTYQPLLMCPLGGLHVTPRLQPTFRAYVSGVKCALNKSLFSLMNSGTNVVRVNEIWIYVPPQGQFTPGTTVLGSGNYTQTYYPLTCEIRRITSQATNAASSTVSTVTVDSADTVDSNVAMLTSATVSGAASLPTRTYDAIIGTQTGMPFYKQLDVNNKSMVIRPGEGFSVNCLTNGAIASGAGTATASVNVEAVYSVVGA